MAFDRQASGAGLDAAWRAVRSCIPGLLRPQIRLGLHRKFLLLVALGLALCLGVFGAVSLQALDTASQRELDERLLLAKMAARQIDHAVSDTLKTLQMAAGTQGDLAGDSEFDEQRLRNVRAQADLPVRSVSILDAAGRVFWSDPDHASPVGTPLLGDRDIAKAFQTKSPAVSGLRSDENGSPAIVLTVPMLAPDGRLVGAVSGEFELDDGHLLDAMTALQLGQTGKVQLVDDRGTVLDSREHYEDLALGDRSRFMDLARNRSPYVGVCHECHVAGQGTDQRQDVIAFAPLSSAPFGVLLRQSADETFAAVRELRLKLIGFGVLLLIAGLLLTQLTVRAIVKPVEVLTGAAQRIANGDLNSRIPRVGQSEIAVLSEALDGMRDRLLQSRAAAEQWNEQLEANVTQRTNELSALLRSAKSLAATLDVDVLLDSLLMTASEVLADATAGGAVWLLERDGEDLSIRARSGSWRDLPDLSAYDNLARSVFDSGEALLRTRPELIRDSKLTPGIGSCAGAVLAAGGKRIGAILLASPAANAFGEADLRLLGAMAGQAAVAVENAELYAEVRRHQISRGELLARLFGAQEEERRRIARELHDETSQALTAVVMNLARLRKLPAGEARAAALDDAEQIVAGTLHEIHRLVYDLRPTMLDDLGLVPAIEWFIESLAKKSHLELQLSVEGLDDRLPAQVETALFRIVQEAITNVVRHAGASKASVRLATLNGMVFASIQDNGRGFAAGRSNPLASGTGLLGIQERVSFLSGEFSVDSTPGGGTRLEVKIPLPRPEPAAARGGPITDVPVRHRAAGAADAGR